MAIGFPHYSVSALAMLAAIISAVIMMGASSGWAGSESVFQQAGSSGARPGWRPPSPFAGPIPPPRPTAPSKPGVLSAKRYAPPSGLRRITSATPTLHGIDARYRRGGGFARTHAYGADRLADTFAARPRGELLHTDKRARYSGRKPTAQFGTELLGPVTVLSAPFKPILTNRSTQRGVLSQPSWAPILAPVRSRPRESGSAFTASGAPITSGAWASSPASLGTSTRGSLFTETGRSSLLGRGKVRGSIFSSSRRSGKIGDNNRRGATAATTGSSNVFGSTRGTGFGRAGPGSDFTRTGRGGTRWRGGATK